MFNGAIFSCNSLTYWLSSILSKLSLSNSSIASCFTRVFFKESVLCMSSRTCFLFALWLCKAKQNSARPSSDKRLYTTCRAAIFSETNNTFLSAASASAIILVIVWLLPVPGGPCITKLTPRLDNSIASCWLESALKTWKHSLGAIVSWLYDFNSSGILKISEESPIIAFKTGLL